MPRVFKKKKNITIEFQIKNLYDKIVTLKL